MAIQEFELDEIEEFPDEPEAPPDLLRSSEIIDARPEARAAIKKQMADEMARLRGSAEDIKDVSRVANVASGIEQSQQLIPRVGAAAADLYANSPFYKLAEAGIKKAVPSLSGELDVLRGMPQGLLQDFEKRNQQLAREQEALGVRDIPGQIIEGTTKAALELPVQMIGGAGAKGAQALKAVSGGQGVLGALTSYGEDRAKGKGVGESALYGGASGLITGLVTKAFGSTGAESILRSEGVKGVLNRILSASKDAGMEGLEELTDTFYQDLLERITRNPNKPVAQSVAEMLMSAGIGTIIGGGAGTVASTMGESGIPEFDLESGKNAPPSPIEGGQNAIQPEGAPISGPVRDEAQQGVQEVPGEGASATPDVGGGEEGQLSVAATPEVARDTSEDAARAIGEAMGAEFQGAATSKNRSLWRYELKNPDGSSGTSITVPAGSTLTEARAKYEAKRQQYIDEGDEANAPRPMKPAVETEGQLSVASPAKPEVANMAPTDLVGGRKNSFGDPANTTYHATPEDWATWQTLEPATFGNWQQREEIKNKYGGMPPEAPKQGSLSATHNLESYEPIPIEKTQAVAERFKRDFPGATKINVVKDYHGMPDASHQEAYRVGGSPQLIEAFLAKDGQIWVNASAVKSEEHAYKLMLHEAVGHWATNREKGKKLVSFMRSVESSVNAEKDPLMALVKKSYPDGSKFTHGSEYVARLAENPDANPTMWNKIVAAFREWLRDLGIVRKVSENDMRVLVRKAAQSLRAKEDGRSPEEASLSMGNPRGEEDAIGGLESETPETLDRDRKALENSIRQLVQMGYPDEEILNSGNGKTLGKAKTKKLIESERSSGSLSLGKPKGEDDLEFTPLDPQSGTPKGEDVGLGGQRREATPAFVTSNKNARVDEERKARGLPPMAAVERQSNQEAWDEAATKTAAQTDNLILELKGNEDTFRRSEFRASNPRAVTPVENAMLLQRRVELRNDYEKALRAWKEAYESGNMEKASEQDQLSKASAAALADLDTITKATGTESGRSLQARKMEAREDYSLAKMEMEAMQAKGRSLTPEEHIELIRAHEKIAELQARLETVESKKEERGVESGTDAAINGVKNDKSKDFDIDREEKLVGAIKAKVAKGQLNEITSDVQKLARVLWLRGYRTREPLIDQLHATLQTIVPGITRDETKRAFSGYGNFKPLSKEDIDVGLRDLRGQTQQVLKMEAIEGRRPLEKTGQERREPSDEERRLIKQVNELKRKFGVVVTDPATQLKSALQSRKTYYEHRIADLKHEIETRERIVKTKSASPTDPELDALIAEHERLKEEHSQIFTKPGMSDEQRLKMAIQAAERNLAHWEVRLNNAENGIFDRRQPGRKVTSPELEAIQAQAAAIREHVKELHDLANPKKTKEQIALQSLKTRMKNREAELRDRIARSDFSKKVKTPTKLDPEAQELKAKLDIAKEDYATKLEQDRWSKASVFEKGKTQAGRLYDAARAIMTTGELSFLLRQGKFQALSRPIQTLKTLPSTFKALFGSDEKVRQIEREILDDPLMDQARQDKLFIDEHQSSRLSRQDEIMMGQLVGKIPIVKNFNNAARVFLNKTRFDTWKALKNSLSPTGDAEVDRAEGRQIAKFVNEATGRGGLGKFEAAAVPLARIMFSPRYFASRLQMASGHSMWGGTNRTRKLIAAEYAKAIIGMGLYYALLKAYFSDDKDKTKGDIEIDPRSGNFGTVKVGKKSYIDPLAGLAQVATFAARTGTTAMNAMTGGKTPETKRQSGRMGRLRGDDYGQDRWTDVAKRFAMSKAHPVLGAVAGSLDGVDLVGNPTTPINEASKMVRPITYGDIYKAVKDEGVDHEAALTLVAILGEGVRTYEKKKK